jgi:N-acetyltransferase
MITLSPVTLEGNGVRLEPLNAAHEKGLIAAASDGSLWELWYTAVPGPDIVGTYIADALTAQEQGIMLPWAVRDLASGEVVGSTRYHDILPAIDRVEIGYTWYASRCQRTHINTACKLLLLQHAFETIVMRGCRAQNRQFQFPVTARNRRHWSEEGWSDSSSPGAPRRHGA